jgi:hypothetical protein
MGGSFDAKMLQQQQQQDQQQASQNAQQYNPDGSGKANDYHGPPHLPPSTFPKLGPSGGGGGTLMVDRTRLTQIATQMATDLAKLRATLETLYSEGAGGELIYGWPTAEAFGANAGNAYAGISQFYSDLNNAYDLVISNIHQTVSNYADAETSTVTAANRVSPDNVPGNLA